MAISCKETSVLVAVYSPLIHRRKWRVQCAFGPVFVGCVRCICLW